MSGSRSRTYVRARTGALADAMKRHGMSIRDVASRTTDPSVSVQTIHFQIHVETSFRNIELSRAKSIARAIGEPVGTLFCYPTGEPIGDWA